MAFNYKNYLKSKLQELTDLKIEVVDELDFRLNSDIKVIIKYLTGTLHKGTKVQPIQIYVLSDNVEEAKLLLDTFATTYSQTKERIDFQNVKQTYTTPVVLDNFMQIKNKQISALYISGMLTILEGVVDISKIVIDDEEILPIDTQEHYIVQTTTQKVNNEFYSYNKHQTATYSISITMKNDKSVFCENLKQLRHGKTRIPKKFQVKIYYDNESQPITHSMLVIDHNLITSEANMPTVSVVLGVEG